VGSTYTEGGGAERGREEDNPRPISAFSLHRFRSRQDSILSHVPRHELLFLVGDRSDNSNDSNEKSFAGKFFATAVRYERW
jgi:hypothetical protein